MKKQKTSFYLKIFLVGVILLFGSGIFIFFQLSKLAKSLPDPQVAGNWEMTESTKFYDKTGQVLLYEINLQGKRTIVPFDQIPERIKQATVAIEDENFYQHAAIDWKALFRAFFTNIISGGVVQGGSTITQQLAKNAFLSPEKTYSRKLREAILAYWIEKYYTKDEILNLYFNQIPYGAGANGVEAASQTYFGKSASDLNLVESATLAAMLQLPSYYSPWGLHVDELMQRKNYVLEKMFQLGYIDEEELNRNKALTPNFVEQNLGNIKAPHFVIMVKDYLITKYGEDLVNRGGLKVITTLDWELQQIAERVIKEGAQRNFDLYKGKNAALVAQDPKTGHILALVGSANYFDESVDGNFNVAAQGLRQPGSSIKPLAYITAFKKGYSQDSVVFDVPTEFSTNPSCPVLNINYNSENKLCFHPQNFDQIFRGPINLRNALAQSINIPAVKVLYLAGLQDVIQTAQDFGITSLNDPQRYGLSLVLGGGEVKLIELVGAYSVFAQDGARHQQTLVLNVKDASGNNLESYLDKAVQVIEPQYARMINDILSDSEARRPLFQGSFNLTVFNDREVALKTGTTDDYRDAWAIGYTPKIAVGVWAGNNKQEPMQKSAGSILAAIPIWSAFLNEAFAIIPPSETFIRPDSIEQNKPMLNGQYIYENQIHNILHYIDKANPLGEFPENPSADSQYNNWELPVQVWLRQFSPNIIF